MSKRILWADIVRILAIYFIVVLHVVSIPPHAQTNFIFSIGLTLADTCVPLLVMLSGALLLGKQESYSTFFRKRASRVVYPWITWTVIFTFISVFFQNNYQISNIVHNFHLIFIPFFWFIVLICALYLLTPALRIFAQAATIKDLALVIFVWFLVVSVIPSLHNTEAFPLHVDNGVVRLVINYIGYYLFGFLIVKSKLQKKYLTGIEILFVVSLLGRSTLEYFSMHNNMQLINGADFIDPSLIILSSSLFSLLYLLEDVFIRVLNKQAKNLLFIISKTTLGIYFVHYLFLSRAPLPFLLSTTSLVHISYNIDLFINAFIFFVLSFIIIFLLQKIPLIKNIIT